MPLNRSICYDIPADEPRSPKPGEHLISRYRTGHLGTAYLIISVRLVKQRKTDFSIRRYHLTVQRQEQLEMNEMVQAEWWLQWHPDRKVRRPDFFERVVR